MGLGSHRNMAPPHFNFSLTLGYKEEYYYHKEIEGGQHNEQSHITNDRIKSDVQEEN